MLRSEFWGDSSYQENDGTFRSYMLDAKKLLLK